MIDLSLVEPKLAIPSHHHIMSTNGLLHDLSTGGRSEAEQPVVLWIVLLAPFEDERKIGLSSAFGDLPQSHGLSKMTESSFMKTLSALSNLQCSPPGPMDLSGKQSLL